MYKNTLKKPKSQLYFSFLSHKKNTRLNNPQLFSDAAILLFLSFFLYDTRSFWNYCLIATYHTHTHTRTHTHTHIYIYICARMCVCVTFIKLALGTPNTTCIQSITMTELGLVGPYGLVAKFKPHFIPH